MDLVLGNSYINNAVVKLYVGWNWKANGQGSANTDGSITQHTLQLILHQVFQLVTQAQVQMLLLGHGLMCPQMILCKRHKWYWFLAIYHASLGATKYLALNETIAAEQVQLYGIDTTPTSSVFSIGTVNGLVVKLNSLCFCRKNWFQQVWFIYWQRINADGTFVYTGFKPAFLFQKRSVQQLIGICMITKEASCF